MEQTPRLEAASHASLYSTPQTGDPADLYLHLLELCLCGLLVPHPVTAAYHGEGEVRMEPVDPANLWRRFAGSEAWPSESFTMIGVPKLENIRSCIEDVLARNVPGDFIETGVWRGGAAIFMRALLKVRQVDDRIVFAADSFEGLPPPNPDAYPADRDLNLHMWDFLAVPVDEVTRNFEKFGLLDEQVRFVKGWFRDTLPTLSDRTWALVRLDGDLYESTINALENLYPNISPGGYVIIDDYGVSMCREAVHDYRREQGIEEEMRDIGDLRNGIPDTEPLAHSVFWQKSG